MGINNLAAPRPIVGPDEQHPASDMERLRPEVGHPGGHEPNIGRLLAPHARQRLTLPVGHRPIQRRHRRSVRP